MQTGEGLGPKTVPVLSKDAQGIRMKTWRESVLSSSSTGRVAIEARNEVRQTLHDEIGEMGQQARESVRVLYQSAPTVPNPLSSPNQQRELERAMDRVNGGIKSRGRRGQPRAHRGFPGRQVVRERHHNEQLYALIRGARSLPRL